VVTCMAGFDIGRCYSPPPDYQTATTFEQLKLDSRLVQAVRAGGLDSPTEIQVCVTGCVNAVGLWGCKALKTSLASRKHRGTAPSADCYFSSCTFSCPTHHALSLYHSPLRLPDTPHPTMRWGLHTVPLIPVTWLVW
jgi:hypothetical protein